MKIKTVLIFVLLILILYVLGYAQNVTLYYRNDIHAVSGLLGNILMESQSNSHNSYRLPYGQAINYTYYYATDVIIRHVDGAETVIGSNIAQFPVTINNNGHGEGIYVSTWNCPEIVLQPKDAIKIVEKIISSWNMPVLCWISEPLNAVKLKASTWQFKRYLYWDYQIYVAPDQKHYWTDIHWGDSTYNTRIEGISYDSVNGFAAIY